MSPPVPRINTFFQRTNKSTIEPISKIFIKTNLIFGLNRLTLLGNVKPFCIVSSVILTTILNVVLPALCILSIFMHNPNKIWIFLSSIDILQYLLCNFLGFIFCERLRNFYINLNKFDEDVGINPKIIKNRESVYNLVHCLVTMMITIVLFLLSEGFTKYFVNIIPTLPVKFLICSELHYYGHLLSLMISRLKSMSNCMKFSYSSNKTRGNFTHSTDDEVQKDTKSFADMKKLVEIYNNIVIAYDSLNEAIKWQILIFLLSTFIVTLGMLYKIVKMIILENSTSFILLETGFMVIQLSPILMPCVFADRIRREVTLIKNFVTSKLNDKTLDKPSRSSTRTLLALMETRNLSFALFHMFDIDISLPFKFMALILTYLIIILQFDKVISPNIQI